MSGISLLERILSIVGFGSIVGSIIGLLFGQWLVRGRPHISLVRIEPGIGTKQKDQREPVLIPQTIVDLSKKLKEQWNGGLLIEEEMPFSASKELLIQLQGSSQKISRHLLLASRDYGIQ